MSEKEAVSRLKEKVIGEKAVLNSLDSQYKSVIKELRKQLIWWQTNAWKATFVSSYYKIKSLFERG